MLNPAIPGDVASRWRPLSDQETQNAQTFLNDAWVLLARRMKRLGVDLDAQDAADPMFADDVVRVLCAAVLRVMKNPDGKRQESIDDYSWSMGEAAASGLLGFTDEELDEVKLETTRTLDIERFVDAATIDRLYWNDPYFLVPDDESGIEAYSVIRDAMANSERIALGRVVMHTRERLMAIEPRGKGLVAYTLRMHDEVRDPEQAFRDISDAKPDKKMIEIAEKIIDQKEGPFDTEDFKDRYETALRELIRKKEKGEKLVSAPEPEDTNVIDLMAALQKSLKQKGKTPVRSAKARKRRAS